MGIRGFQLPGLIGGGRGTSVCKDLIRRIKAGEIPDLSEDHRAHAVTDTGDRQNGRRNLIHDLFDLGFDFCDLRIQFSDQAECVS